MDTYVPFVLPPAPAAAVVAVDDDGDCAESVAVVAGLAGSL
jgi:hypothetical protein